MKKLKRGQGLELNLKDEKIDLELKGIIPPNIHPTKAPIYLMVKAISLINEAITDPESPFFDPELLEIYSKIKG